MLVHTLIILQVVRVCDNRISTQQTTKKKDWNEKQTSDKNGQTYGVISL
jgi:hypothetical protein